MDELLEILIASKYAISIFNVSTSTTMSYVNPQKIIQIILFFLMFRVNMERFDICDVATSFLKFGKGNVNHK